MGICRKAVCFEGTMSNLIIERNAVLPDPLRVARARALPNLGPRLLFLSGGSALNEVSRQLKAYTHNSIHLITPFDSGGSSQVLRQAFGMPAVGDLRSRLMALADETELGQPDIFRLFSYRFPKQAAPKALAAEFAELLHGRHKLTRALTQPMRGLVLGQLRAFDRHRPDDFDFAGASVGNLILAGGYMDTDQALEPVLFMMSKMVDVLGTVRSVVDGNLGLGADLADGQRVLGQRELTGKEVAPLTAAITRLFITRDGQELPHDAVKLPKRNRALIEKADLICYPPGSFYTSVLANLLPRDVGRTIAGRRVPKIYVPSLGDDPEAPGMTLSDRVAALLNALRMDAGPSCASSDLLSAVLCDVAAVSDKEARRCEAEHDLPVLRLPLARAGRPGRYDPETLCDLLVSLT